MNDSIKVSLTIRLEGSTLVQKSSPEVIKYQITKKDINPQKRWEKKEGAKVIKKGKVEYYPKEAKPAILHINISKEAYDYMISKECPSWKRAKVWSKMTTQQRLDAHLQRTCEHHHGKSYIYQILDD